MTTRKPMRPIKEAGRQTITTPKTFFDKAEDFVNDVGEVVLLGSLCVVGYIYKIFKNL